MSRAGKLVSGVTSVLFLLALGGGTAVNANASSSSAKVCAEGASSECYSYSYCEDNEYCGATVQEVTCCCGPFEPEN